MPSIGISVREPPKTIADLDDLVADLRALGTDFDVSVQHDPYTGTAVTWGQLFFFVLDETERHVIDVVVGAFAAWAWKLLRKDRSEGRRGRPRHLTIYGPEGEVLRQVNVTEPDELSVSQPEEPPDVAAP